MMNKNRKTLLVYWFIIRECFIDSSSFLISPHLKERTYQIHYSKVKMNQDEASYNNETLTIKNKNVVLEDVNNDANSQSSQSIQENNVSINDKSNKTYNSWLQNLFVTKRDSSNKSHKKNIKDVVKDKIEKDLNQTKEFVQNPMKQYNTNTTKTSKLSSSSMYTTSFQKTLNGISIDSNFRMKLNETKRKKIEKVPPLISSLDPNAVITVADLQKILRENNYVPNPNANVLDKSASSSLKKTKGVAFPQPSVLDVKYLTATCFVTTGALGAFLGMSISKNLWLAGFLLGGLYGQKVAKENDGNPTDIPFSVIILEIAKRFANISLTVWDGVQGIWFMYKTGQLSYEYYKTYAKLDKRFQIQNKVDGWNMRFQEGKKNFDAWEKENEVGRKILAGLRTAWLVEEVSSKKISKGSKGSKFIALNRRSKYRIVNYINRVISFIKDLAQSIWNSLAGKNGHEKDISDVMKGVQLSLSETNFETFSQRAGSGIAALVVVNFIGGLFTIAPSLLGLFAIGTGMIFPNWVAGIYVQVVDFLKDLRNRGRGGMEQIKSQTTTATSKYHFYIQPNGKKRWYRTANSKFKRMQT